MSFITAYAVCKAGIRKAEKYYYAAFCYMKASSPVLCNRMSVLTDSLTGAQKQRLTKTSPFPPDLVNIR